jgi:hypothetical protein
MAFLGTYGLNGCGNIMFGEQIYFYSTCNDQPYECLFICFLLLPGFVISVQVQILCAATGVSRMVLMIARLIDS